MDEQMGTNMDMARQLAPRAFHVIREGPEIVAWFAAHASRKYYEGVAGAKHCVEERGRHAWCICGAKLMVYGSDAKKE